MTEKTAPEAVAPERRTITVGFTGDDIKVYDELVRLAAEDERPLAQFVLRQLRNCVSVS